MRLSGSIAALRRFAAEAPAAVERCDRCAAVLAASHPHWLDAKSRRMRCVCGSCGDANAPWKLVRRRVAALRELDGDTDAWDRLGSPVGLAFVALSGENREPFVYFPGPAGATAAAIDWLDWATLCARVPAVGGMHADIEALLVNRLDGARDHYIVSIDICYHLVGRLRQQGRGWAGDVGREVEGFMTSLRREAAHA